MRVLRLLAMVALVAVAGCGLFGGPEGHYSIDKKLTAAALDDYAEKQLTEVVTQLRGKDARPSDEERKRMKDEMRAMFDKMAIDLNLNPGGKFRGSATIEGKMEISEGTWALRGKTLEITETSENGKPRAKPKTETFRYDRGLLSFEDTKDNPPFIILSKQ